MEQNPKQEIQNLIEDENNANDIVIESEPLKDDNNFHPKKYVQQSGYNSGGVSGYNISDHSCDDDFEDTESIAMLTAFETELMQANLMEITPLAKCCNAFWNLFKYISVFMALFWILFLSILLFQPSMIYIRSIIYDIDPISSKNHPVPHRINSKESCATYDINKLSQFSFGKYFISIRFLRNTHNNLYMIQIN